jgi:hypothetical protein
MDPTRLRPTRLRPPGVVPLEPWDLELRAGILWDHMEHDTLPAALVEAIEQLRQGTARTRSRTPIPARVRDVRAVWLAGGRARSLDARGLTTALDLPVYIAQAPTTVAERGARVLVPEATLLAVIDLGQSRLKLSVGGRRFAFARPWDRLPLCGGPADREPARARAALRVWVSDALAQARTRPDAVVFALPCELPDTPIPGSSSYAGLQGDAGFVPDVLAAAGWAPRCVLVLNDAELAAVAAGLDPRTHGTLTLVLTLGFGVGGALKAPRTPTSRP